MLCILLFNLGSSGGSRTLGEQTPARACSAPVFSMTLDCSPLSINETRPARSYLRHHNIATRLGSSLISGTFPFTAHSLRGIARCLRTSLLWVIINYFKELYSAVYVSARMRLCFIHFRYFVPTHLGG